MNKEERKKAVQEYKKKGLQKDLVSDNPFISHFAQLQLGLSSEPLTVEKILKTSDDQLIDLVYKKIEEVAEKQYKIDLRKYKSSENALKNLPFHFQAIYFTHQFEMQITIGDCNKFFDNSFQDEIEIVTKAYRFLGFPTLGNLILEAMKGNYEFEVVEDEYQLLEESIRNSKIKFIRNNAREFELL